MLLTKRRFPYTWRPATGQPLANEDVIFDKGYLSEFGLVGAWVFNRIGLRDLIGNTRDGVSIGDSFGLQSGKYGIGVNFDGDGNSDRISLGSITSADPLCLAGINTGSVAFRAKADSGAGNSNARLFDKSSGGNASNGWAVFLSPDNEYVFRAGNAGGSNSDISLTLGEWQSWGGSRAGSAGDWYLEGDDVGAGGFTSSSDWPSTTTNAAFGNWNHSTDRNWHGDIEYFFAFNKTLPQEELARIAREPYRYIVPRPASQLIFVPGGEPPPPVTGRAFLVGSKSPISGGLLAR